MRRLFKTLIALVVMLPFVLAACGGTTNSTTSPTGSNTSRNLHFVVVTHGQASDPFWSVVKKGVEQAAKDMGVSVQYEAPNTFDMVAMAHLIDAAVATKPDGLVVSIPDPTASRLRWWPEDGSCRSQTCPLYQPGSRQRRS